MKKFMPVALAVRDTTKKFMLVALAMILTLSAFSVRQAQAAPAEPPIPGRGLTALLSGPAIDGVVPEGKANFLAVLNETSLAVGASNLNLPDGTVLSVALDGVEVLKMSVIGGQAGRLLSPSPQVHSGELITISISDGVVIILAPEPGSTILSGTFQLR